LIIWKIFLPKITYSIENRKSRVVNDLDEAQKLKESAEKKLNEYNEIIEKSKKEAKKIIEDSKKKLDRDIENKKQKFNNEIEKELVATEKEKKYLKKTSISNIGNIAAEISVEVIKQIINIEVNKSSVTAIVDDVVKRKMVKYK
jgi:F-type H+-transporting ATPase subunit b